jgi:hypothetical protein
VARRGVERGVCVLPSYDVDRDIREGEEFAEKLRAGAPSIFEELSGSSKFL